MLAFYFGMNTLLYYNVYKYAAVDAEASNYVTKKIR